MIFKLYGSVGFFQSYYPFVFEGWLKIGIQVESALAKISTWIKFVIVDNLLNFVWQMGRCVDRSNESEHCGKIGFWIWIQAAGVTFDGYLCFCV